MSIPVVTYYLNIPLIAGIVDGSLNEEGTIHNYHSIPTPGQQLVHEVPDLTNLDNPKP